MQQASSPSVIDFQGLVTAEKEKTASRYDEWFKNEYLDFYYLQTRSFTFLGYYCICISITLLRDLSNSNHDADTVGASPH